jgi:hypothetical protein
MEDDNKSECDTCGKLYDAGIAIWIVYPIVFIVCFTCYDLLYDDENGDYDF